MDETAAPAPAPTPAPAPAPAPRSIGERLRAGRERAGLSVAASAEKLHLDPKVIESLEADRFAELGASVYVRGHLRRYADFVGEPGTELVESYLASREKKPPPPDLTQIPHADRRSDPRRLVTPLVGLSCAAVLLLAIWWVLAGSRTGADKSSGAGTASPANPSIPAALPATPEPLPATPVIEPMNTGSVPANTTAANAPPPRRDETPNSRETRLRLELTNDSWVEVYDSRGERLFYDVASSGSVQSVAGRGPLRVVLGNASGVTVEVNGERKEIPANAVDGEGARFVVNRAGSLTRAR